MPITPLQIGSTFGRVKIASAINLLGPPQGGKSGLVRRVVCQVRSYYILLITLGRVVSVNISIYHCEIGAN